MEMAITAPNEIAPIADDDAGIAKALADAHLPSLRMSLVHLTGDESILRDPSWEQAAAGDESALAAVHERALGVLAQHRDGALAKQSLPTPTRIQAMMGAMAGSEVPAEYVPMMIEEMTLSGDDAHHVRWGREIPAERRGAFKVIIIGAGLSGILTAIRLSEAGIPFEIIEKNPDVGGTWFENAYPGCRVDVPNHFYSYSFALHDWSSHFSERDELLAYFREVAERFGIRSKVRFNTEVIAARYDEDAQWQVTVRDAGGEESELVGNALVSAVGQLNRPKLPDIKGVDTFRGETIHSGAWDANVLLAGKRIVVVGTGASAFQLVPEVAKMAAQVTVFQRSAPWVAPTPNYHRPVEAGHRWLLRHVPFYSNWYRFWLFWSGCDALLKSLTREQGWEGEPLSVSAANQRLRDQLTTYMTGQIEDDDELLSKIIPDYPPGGKRMLRDNGTWLRTLQRDNVSLVTEAVDEILPDGVMGVSGKKVEADVIIYATGFNANHFLWPMKIVGRDGVALDAYWGDDPHAYLGITVPHFPNLFCVYGPNTNLVHGGSIIFHSECQVHYILECLRLLLTDDHRSMVPKVAVCDEYNKAVDAANSERAWGIKAVSSWYKNSQGRVTQNWPWRLVDHWRMTREPDVDAFEWR